MVIVTRLLCIMCYILQPDWSLLLSLNTQSSLHCKQGSLLKHHSQLPVVYISLQLPVSLQKICCYYRKGKVEKTLTHPTFYEIRPEISISMCNYAATKKKNGSDWLLGSRVVEQKVSWTLNTTFLLLLQYILMPLYTIMLGKIDMFL